ncbi:MAG: phosphoglucosamine mutase, partial [Rhodothermales bacterium]|nr:phosphoglucosamine mutase [Rhodothermales bacterium]
MPDKTLIASISGIRGIFGSGLSPDVLVQFASAFASWCVETNGGGTAVVVGRDARVTGELCSRIVTGTLAAAGLDVIDAGLATTPTVEMAVIEEKAGGGIVLSASHNPGEWNALKLLNDRGEFLSPEQGARVLQLAEEGADPTVGHQMIGTFGQRDYLDHHIDAILGLPFVDPEEIRTRGFRVLVDGVNSVGGIAIPRLLKRLG